MLLQSTCCRFPLRSILNLYFPPNLLSIYSQKDLAPQEPSLGKLLILSAPNLHGACISLYPSFLLSCNNSQGIPPFILMLSVRGLQLYQKSCTRLCVCVRGDLVLCYGIACVDSRGHHHSQDTEQFHHKDISCYPFIATVSSIFSPLPNLCQPLIHSPPA